MPLSQHGRGLELIRHTHPTDEAKRKVLTTRGSMAETPQLEAVDTLGGRVRVQRKGSGEATPQELPRAIHSGEGIARGRRRQLTTC